MLSRFFKIFLLVFLLVFLILPSFWGKALSSEQERQALEEELKRLEEQISQYEKDITKTEQEKKTLQNEIYLLNQKVNKLNLEIQQSNIIIKDLGGQIKDTELSIDQVLFKIGETKGKLTGLLRLIYEEDQRSFVEILLSEPNLSGFFDNLVALEVLNKKNQELLTNIKELKIYLEKEKQSLGEEKYDLEKFVNIQTIQRQENQTIQKEKDYYLKLTESQYQKYIQQKEVTEQQAAEIRARIFQLAGISEVEMPTFGQALETARWVQQQTGVRPAFLLSIITQESALARNVGQCYLFDLSSGRTYHVNTNRQFPRGINPTRDLPPFLRITKELGMDPLSTPISCWIDVGRGPNFGWGGAMGPAQFIPSTWMAVRDKVSSITKSSLANPWNVRDSFLAAGVYLRDLGAASNELSAAGRYFGAPGLLSYDSTVMRRANCLQIFIDKGTISEQCERLVFTP